MKGIQVDVAVIGAGTAGLAACRAAKAAGASAVIIEDGEYGTTCARVGCMPSKLLIAAAEAAHAVGQAAQFGIHVNEEFLLEPDAHIADMQLHGNRVAIRRTGPDGNQTIEYFDYVLAVTGRTPNVTGIGLDNTTLTLDAKGVPASDPATTRTISTNGASPIFIAGDASNFIPLLHEAADEGRIAGENAARLALGMPVLPGLRRAPISIVFTDPQIAIVGGGFHSLKPDTFEIGQASFEDQGRARVLLKNKGLLNVYGEIATGRFLGAEMLAPAAEHLAHLTAWALQGRMTVEQMLEMPFYHPVIEEGLRTALRDLDGKLRSAQASKTG